MSVIQLSARELQNKLAGDVKPLLLDVREPDEFEFTHIAGSKLIPLNLITQRMSEIDSSEGCVVICHHGIRSQQAAAYLVRAGLSNIYNLSGGIEAWSMDCDNTVLRY
jgi:rhodanese-related sulfurtransferase